MGPKLLALRQHRGHQPQPAGGSGNGTTAHYSYCLASGNVAAGGFASGSCRPIAVNRCFDVGGGEAAIVGKGSFGLSRYRLGAVSYIPCDVCTSQGYARRGCSRTDHRHSREGCCSA